MAGTVETCSISSSRLSDFRPNSSSLEITRDLNCLAGTRLAENESQRSFRSSTAECRQRTKENIKLL